MPKPKILLLDIETAPSIAYVWRLFDENISVDQIISPTRMICWASKWYGQKDISFASEWNDGPVEMVHVGKNRFVGTGKDVRISFDAAGNRSPDSVRVTAAPTRG